MGETLTELGDIHCAARELQDRAGPFESIPRRPEGRTRLVFHVVQGTCGPEQFAAKEGRKLFGDGPGEVELE